MASRLPSARLPLSTLNLFLSTRGMLKPRVSDDALGVRFVDGQRGSVLNFAGLKAWDADEKRLASHFESARKGLLRLQVEECAARYPVTIDPIAQQAYLKPAGVGTTPAPRSQWHAAPATEAKLSMSIRVPPPAKPHQISSHAPDLRQKYCYPRRGDLIG
jgi:hypothetical protein